MPFLKNGQPGFERIFETRDLQLPFIGGFFEIQINKIIDETIFCSDFSGKGIVYFADLGPIGGCEAHRAGFGGRYKNTVFKMWSFEFSTVVADCIHLRMAAGIVIFEYGVVADSDNFPVEYDYCTKRTSVFMIHAV